MSDLEQRVRILERRTDPPGVVGALVGLVVLWWVILQTVTVLGVVSAVAPAEFCDDRPERVLHMACWFRPDSEQ